MLCVGWVAVASAQDAAPAQRSLFPEGQCSGILCSTIGGAQAPQQQQRSLFREGPCSGILCSVIGGSQAPAPPSYPPPPCGGGLLCSIDPYGSGVPMTAAEVGRIRAEHARQEAEAPVQPAVKPAKKHRHVAKRKVAAAAQ